MKDAGNAKNAQNNYTRGVCTGREVVGRDVLWSINWVRDIALHSNCC
jgi:hypothetical protein